MKLVMDEKLKHRLVGLSVILSLGAIFLPAMMKKSSQRLEHNLSVNVQLPPKPVAPHVAVTDKEQVFKTIKIAKVVVPDASQETSTDAADFIAIAPADKELVKPVAELNSSSTVVEKPIELALSNAAQTAARKEVKIAHNKPETPIVKSKIVKAVIPQVASKPPVSHQIATQKPVSKREIYAVQLASFAKLANAQALVHKLQSKGYKANYVRVSGRNGAIYKVYAGHSSIKDNVVKLKVQLASAMQLNGFVVNTGVS